MSLLFGLTFTLIVLDVNFWLSKLAVIKTVPESSSNVSAEAAQLTTGASLSAICIVLLKEVPSWAPSVSPVTPVMV